MSEPIRPNPQPGSKLLSRYVPQQGSFDEVVEAGGEIRPAWKELLKSLDAIGVAEFTRRWARAQEEVRENGVTYNAYEDNSAKQRPWELDALPFLISPQEWEVISTGLVQRATLLNRILVDLYGSQELLESGVIPPEWLFSHPGFRRRFHDPNRPERPYLYTYAADLARGADGKWWVVGDRTDAPLGLGYALENRVAASRMFPNIVRQFHVERLAQFFISLQETLRGLAPKHRENPRVVLLSHGPSGPNYFEDAYLARYLGYTLVEGADLAVRDDHVYLKTLSGLLPVDVIWRRLSDDYCDPLEIRAPARLGVPGLLQAERLGNVAIANSMGTSVIESPSLLPFLPAIAQKWGEENLILNSIATWWCGQESARRQVRQLQNGFMFRSAYRVARQETTPTELLWAKSRDEINQLIERRPSEIVAQESIRRATAPIWSSDGVAEPRHVALRVFLVAHRGSYQVMPGGLVRMARKSHSLDLSILAGEISKDAWVLSTGPVRQVTLLRTSRDSINLRRTGAEVPSRVADNLFWFGRRVERAQGAGRLLRPAISMLTGEEEFDGAPELRWLIRTLAANGLVEPGFALDDMKKVLPTIAQALPNSTLSETQSGSVRSTFEQAYLNASHVRDRLSLDSWRLVHRIERRLNHAAQQTQQRMAARPDQQSELVELDELLDDLIVDFAALDGLFAESMVRTPAWRFLELGRRLERALYTASLVQALLSEPDCNEAKVLESLLKVADSLMTYRGRYLAAIHPAAALDLLLTDETNPRSLIYQLMAIADHVKNLPHGKTQPLGTPEERITASVLHGVRMLDVDDLDISQGDHVREKLDRLLLRITDQLPKLSNAVSHRYLIHSGRPQQMAEGKRVTK